MQKSPKNMDVLNCWRAAIHSGTSPTPHITSHFCNCPPVEGQLLGAAVIIISGAGKAARWRYDGLERPQSKEFIVVVGPGCLDVRLEMNCACERAHTQCICGLICLLLRWSEPRAVSSQWPHSRQNSGTVMLHVTVYKTPVHLHPREQPSNLCGNSITGFVKVGFQGEMYGQWLFQDMPESKHWHIFDRMFDIVGKTIKSKGPWDVSVDPLRIRFKQDNLTSSSALKCQYLYFIFVTLNQKENQEKA